MGLPQPAAPQPCRRCPRPRPQGWALWRQQVRALLVKRALCAARDWWAAAVQVAVPVALVALALWGNRVSAALPQQPPLPLDRRVRLQRPLRYCLQSVEEVAGTSRLCLALRLAPPPSLPAAPPHAAAQGDGAERQPGGLWRRRRRARRRRERRRAGQLHCWLPGSGGQRHGAGADPPLHGAAAGLAGRLAAAAVVRGAAAQGWPAGRPAPAPAAAPAGSGSRAAPPCMLQPSRPRALALAAVLQAQRLWCLARWCPFRLHSCSQVQWKQPALRRLLPPVPPTQPDARARRRQRRRCMGGRRRRLVGSGSGWHGGSG